MSDTIQIEAYSASYKKQKIYCVGDVHNQDKMMHGLYNQYSEEMLRRHKSVVIFTDVYAKHQPKFLKNTYIDAIFRIRDNQDLRLAYTFIQHTSKPLLVIWYGNDIPAQIFQNDITLFTGGLHPKNDYTSVIFNTKTSYEEANSILISRTKATNVRDILNELKGSDLSLVWSSAEDRAGSLYWFDYNSIKGTMPSINYAQASDYLRNLADVLESKE
jgi:hypothetical protein